MLTSHRGGYDENKPPSYVHHLPNIDIKSAKHDNATAKYNPWVKFVMKPLFVAEMSMKRMEFTSDFNMFVTWEDGRLKIPEKNEVYFGDAVDIKYKLNMINPTLWFPNIQFVNCKSLKEPMKDPWLASRLTLHPWIQRITVNYTFSLQFFCRYSLKRYPFDKQQCSILINYVHSKLVVNFTTEVLLQDISEINIPPEFQLAAIIKSNCPNEYDDESNLVECLKYTYFFQRVYIQHVMLLFIPSMLIVSLSWISFWLDESAAPPRVALGLTSLLTLATQFNNAQKDLPAVADVKAIDVWMFACMIMVFASLVEFAIANFCSRRKLRSESVEKLTEQKTSEPKQLKVPTPKYVYSVPVKQKISIDGFFKDAPSFKRPKRQLHKKKCFLCDNSNSIDVVSRLIFPLVFLVFNIVYWVHFTSE